MMKVFYPSNGKKLEVELGRAGNKFFWCNCENPNFLELKKISDKIKVSFSDLEKYKNNNKSPKIIPRKKYDIILLRYPVYKSNKVLFKNIEIIFNKKFVVTLYDNKINAINDFVKNIKEELVGVKANYFYFLHRVLVALTREFLSTLDKVEGKLEKVEDDVLKPKTNIKNLFFVKKNLLYIRKAIVSNRNVIADLQEGASKFLVPKMVSDIYADVAQILDTEELFRDRLTSSLDLHLSSISNKMNDIMKSFTVIASLLLIPMLVSGIYGMNVRLPLQGNPNAFYSIILFIILSVLLTLLYFRVKKWV